MADTSELTEHPLPTFGLDPAECRVDVIGAFEALAFRKVEFLCAVVHSMSVSEYREVFTQQERDRHQQDLRDALVYVGFHDN